MENIRSFGQIRTGELFIARRGIFNPVYELSDGQFCYAKIDERQKFIGVADNKWTFKKDRDLRGETKTIRISNTYKEVIGSVTFSKQTKELTLCMKNGFRASYIQTKGSHLFGVTSVWKNLQFGDMLSIKESTWNIKKPFGISVDPSLIKKVPELALMILYGVAYNLLKRDPNPKLPLGPN
ncbi:hypothetical protein [Mucilaginibacter sp. FT3.2]|uniref:hypothetical protein n=1 Tax=Mucilaginibacter sp. FT3.2 TaxID=2723090 RepID=UPI00160BCAAE|nr:hypothetical protein [Mucilaginibacter sp. FT3.2]MBB6233811.1 hypothetical protein [Mucilaginibacter sp. FT3.2]